MWGYFFEVDLIYSVEIHVDHNALSFCFESKLPFHSSNFTREQFSRYGMGVQTGAFKIPKLIPSLRVSNAFSRSDIWCACTVVCDCKKNTAIASSTTTTADESQFCALLTPPVALLFGNDTCARKSAMHHLESSRAACHPIG